MVAWARANCIVGCLILSGTYATPRGLLDLISLPFFLDTTRVLMIVWRMPDLISTVKGFYSAFDRGDIATILASVGDEVSWEYEAPSEIVASGIRHSKAEIAEYFSALAEQSDHHNLEMTEFFSNDDSVAVFGRYQGTIKSSGIRVDTPLAHYFKFRDGKVVRHVQLTNTAATLEALRGRAAGATP